MALPLGTTGSLSPAFASARLVGLAVNLVYAFAFEGGFPNLLNQASRASVTV